MPLDRLQDQPRVTALLGRALAAGRVAHAYAFVGPPGAGRTTAALLLAEALLCPQATGAGGCGRCRACAMVAGRRHPDLHVIEPTPPERNPRGPRAIRIDDIRALEREAALRPLLGGRKVFILDDADRMTADTPHAFLKTLEEPPPRTVMILVLASARALPATVLSRCQRVPFAPRPDAAAEAQRAEAIEFFGEVAAAGVEALYRRFGPGGVERERAEGLVDAYWVYCRDLLLVRAGAPAAWLANAGAAERIAREAGAWSDAGLVAEIAACREARRALAVNVAPRLTVEVMLRRLARRAA